LTAPSRYWPRTLLTRTVSPSIGRSDRSAFTFSSRTAVESICAGGSIAMMERICSTWFCTMSRSAPTPS
jgi:hypothetical protein